MATVIVNDLLNTATVIDNDLLNTAIVIVVMTFLTVKAMTYVNTHSYGDTLLNPTTVKTMTYLT